jgi:hypothetical protein
MAVEQKNTKEIRTVLKGVINNELLNIENLLSGLPPKERLEIIVKLIPYVLPKIETVNHSFGEPSKWDLE